VQQVLCDMGGTGRETLESILVRRPSAHSLCHATIRCPVLYCVSPSSTKPSFELSLNTPSASACTPPQTECEHAGVTAKSMGFSPANFKKQVEGERASVSHGFPGRSSHASLLQAWVLLGAAR
jgi:hypothetical protein